MSPDDQSNSVTLSEEHRTNYIQMYLLTNPIKYISTECVEVMIEY